MEPCQTAAVPRETCISPMGIFLSSTSMMMLVEWDHEPGREWTEDCAVWNGFRLKIRFTFTQQKQSTLTGISPFDVARAIRRALGTRQDRPSILEERKAAWGHAGWECYEL